MVIEVKSLIEDKLQMWSKQQSLNAVSRHQEKGSSVSTRPHSSPLGGEHNEAAESSWDSV